MNFQPEFKILRHSIKPANQNQDKQSPLLHVYLMQHDKTIWIRVITWGHLTFVGAFIDIN
jgi:hypothetical protein